MPTLSELQTAFCGALLDERDNGVESFIVAAGFSPSERLGIYRNTFVTTLVSALRITYPAIHRLVGADFFEATARQFIDGHPPCNAWLNEYGAEFGDFLEAFLPAAPLPYLPDVARLEALVNRALHAADVEFLDLTKLARLDGAEHDRVRFVPHPSVGLLRASCPADAIWRAVLDRDDAALAAIDPQAGPTYLLVARPASGVEVTRLSDSAWLFIAALCNGEPLETAAEAIGGDVTASLAEHLVAGRFIRFELAATDQILLPAEAKHE